MAISHYDSFLQCESKIPPAACGFLTFFDKLYFLHTYYTFLSTLDYKFSFSYLKL